MNCVAFFVFFAAATTAAEAQNPLSKAIDLLDSLAAKVTADAAAAAKAWTEYEAWCDGESQNLKFEIKDGEAKTEKLQASITKDTADIVASDDKIESLAGSISSDSQEHQEAAAVRAKEAADFAANEAELVDSISALDRAVMVLQREMKKNPAAFAQMEKEATSNANNLIKALSTVIDAATFPVSDQKKLAALVQAQQQGAGSEDEDLGAPATAAYKTHSESIFDTLEDLKEKAEGQLSDLRKAESTTKHNFLMLEESLQEQISADTKDLDAEKAAKAKSQEGKSIAEGDLMEASKGLDNDKSSFAMASQTCLTATADHESTTKSRDEELTALTTAKKVLMETTSGASGRSYSFLEVDHQSQTGTTLHSRLDLANAEIVNLLKKLAKENHSASLAQLASRIAATLRYGAGSGEDPFVKVKQLITDMLARLTAEAQADMTEKGYCDDELAKTNAKKAELDGEMSKLSTNIDQAASHSSQLKADVKELQATLAKLARSQAEMDSIRLESHQDYVAAKADLELGLSGVRQAVSVIRDYYGAADAASASMLQASDEQPAGPEHEAAAEAGSSVMKALEVVESDFARDLAVEETAEAGAASEYEATTQTNKDSKRIKEQDVGYKTREHKGLDKTVGDLGGDKSTTGTEFDAVLEYLAKLKERCVAKPETYETRRARREAELAGLKEALSILQGESAFVQRGKKHGLHSTFLGTI